MWGLRDALGLVGGGSHIPGPASTAQTSLRSSRGAGPPPSSLRDGMDPTAPPTAGAGPQEEPGGAGLAPRGHGSSPGLQA